MKKLISKLTALPHKTKRYLAIATVLCVAAIGYMLFANRDTIAYNRYISKAEKCMASYDNATAITQLNKAIQLDSQKEKAYIDLMRAYVLNNQSAQALKTLGKAKENLDELQYSNVEKYEQAVYYSQYQEYIDECENEYGAIHERENTSRRALAGAYYISLTDYNNDGINELTIIYENDKEHMGNYQTRLYAYDPENFECKKLFDTNGERYANDYGIIIISEEAEQNCFVSGYTMYTYDGKNLVVQHYDWIQEKKYSGKMKYYSGEGDEYDIERLYDKVNTTKEELKNVTSGITQLSE